MLSQPWQPWGRTEAVASGAWCSIPRCPALCRGHLGCLLLLCGAVLYCICISYLQKWVCVYTKKGPDSHLPKAWLVSTWQDLQGRVTSFAKPNDAFGDALLWVLHQCRCCRLQVSRGGNVSCLSLTWLPATWLSRVGTVAPRLQPCSPCEAPHPSPSTACTARGLTHCASRCLRANWNSNGKGCWH